MHTMTRRTFCVVSMMIVIKFEVDVKLKCVLCREPCGPDWLGGKLYGVCRRPREMCRGSLVCMMADNGATSQVAASAALDIVVS